MIGWNCGAGAFPRMVYLTDEQITVHLISIRVNDCHAGVFDECIDTVERVFCMDHTTNSDYFPIQH
jgi:hypothetical protein